MTRNVIYSMMVSLDGYVARQNGDLDWVIIDEEIHSFVNERQHSVDLYLHGRGMYELLAAYWPTADQDPSNPAFVIEFSRIWKQMPKVVFSRTIDKVDWNASLATRDIGDEIRFQKSQPGLNIDVAGPSLAAACIRQDLIDEFHLYVNPVVLGAGVPMFPPLDHSLPLVLVETHGFQSGVELLRYQRQR